MAIWAAVVFAVLAAGCNALSTVLQRRAARTVPVSPRLRFGLIADLLHRAVWLAGMLMVLPAAAFQALALLLGPLSVVQPIFVLELPLALLIARVVLRGPTPARISPAGWIGVGLMVLGLATALGAAAPTGGRDYAPLSRWVLALIACVSVICLTVGAGLRRGAGSVRAACFGAAAAVGYALTAALLKDASHSWQHGGPAEFFTSWQSYGFAVSGVVALFMMENAMQSGPLTASQPVLTLGDALISLSLGVTLFNERVRAGWWLIPEAVGVGLVLWGAVLLSQVSLARDLATGQSGEPLSRSPRTRSRRRG
ncbi:DMT family transporter [Streptomyces sp. NPDC056149]|uniref:DMT family transporter n=1 Tax=Streptomyces sp. NPDC056149 TaxID=3345728 RepID=UPI0035DB0838